AMNLAKHVRFRESAFDASPVAQIVIDLNGFLVLINERARAFFGLTAKDLGRPLQDLEISFRITELRLRIEEAYTERHGVALKDVVWTTSSGDIRELEVQVVPLTENNNNHGLLGVSITFTDVTRYKRLQEELEHANQELETAYEELQSTN